MFKMLLLAASLGSLSDFYYSQGEKHCKPTTVKHTSIGLLVLVGDEWFTVSSSQDQADTNARWQGSRLWCD